MVNRVGGPGAGPAILSAVPEELALTGGAPDQYAPASGLGGDVPLVTGPLQEPTNAQVWQGRHLLLANLLNRTSTQLGRTSTVDALRIIHDHHIDRTPPRDLAIAGLEAVAARLGVEFDADDRQFRTAAGSGDLIEMDVRHGIGEVARASERILYSWADATEGQISFDELRGEFMVAMLAEFGPHDTYEPASDGDVGGSFRPTFGLRFATTQGPVLDSPDPGSSAEGQIELGDLLVSVDGEPVTDVARGAELLRAAGDTAEIEVQRGEELLQVSLERSQVTPSPVRLHSFEDGVAHIEIQGFTVQTGNDVRAVLAELESLEGVVLDLRGNTGGNVGGATDLVELFRPNHQIREARRDPAVPTGDFTTTGGDSPHQDLPVVLLIDERSASASEVVISGMEGQAVLVGTPSRGKGVGQQNYDLSEGDSIGITNRYSIGPSGAYHTLGYAPSICAASALAALDDGATLAEAAMAGAESACEREERWRLEDVDLGRWILSDPDLYRHYAEAGFELGEYNSYWDPY